MEELLTITKIKCSECAANSILEKGYEKYTASFYGPGIDYNGKYSDRINSNLIIRAKSLKHAEKIASKLLKSLGYTLINYIQSFIQTVNTYNND